MDGRRGGRRGEGGKREAGVVRRWTGREEGEGGKGEAGVVGQWTGWGGSLDSGRVGGVKGERGWLDGGRGGGRGRRVKGGRGWLDGGEQGLSVEGVARCIEPGEKSGWIGEFGNIAKREGTQLPSGISTEAVSLNGAGLYARPLRYSPEPSEIELNPRGRSAPGTAASSA